MRSHPIRKRIIDQERPVFAIRFNHAKERLCGRSGAKIAPDRLIQKTGEVFLLSNDPAMA
jgi:hypothetical protein